MIECPAARPPLSRSSAAVKASQGPDCALRTTLVGSDESQKQLGSVKRYKAPSGWVAKLLGRLCVLLGIFLWEFENDPLPQAPDIA